MLSCCCFCSGKFQSPRIEHLYICFLHCFLNPPVRFPVFSYSWGGRVVQWCWVNFQCRGVLLIWIIVEQGPSVLAVGVGGGCLDISSLVYHFSFLSPSLWETARYRLKYCLKGPLSLKQPTNQIFYSFCFIPLLLQISPLQNKNKPFKILSI